MLECKQRNLRNWKKVCSKMKSNCHGPRDQCPQGAYRKKNLFFKRNERGKEKYPVFIYEHKLKGPFSISTTNFRLKTLTKIMAMLMCRPVINL